VNRTAQLIGSASSGRYDVAVGSHASDFYLTCWTIGIPKLTLIDDERLRGGNLVNVRLVDEVAVPQAVPAAALAALGAPRDKLFRYPGFKEEYYLYDVRPDPDALKDLGIEARRIVGVVRPPRPARTAEGGASPAETTLAALVQDLAGTRNVTLIVVARDREQQRRFASIGLADVLVPDEPADAISLVAAADFVLGVSGVMLREAVALGTPAYTLSRRKPSSVDAALLAEDRLRRAEMAEDVTLKKKDRRADNLPAAPRDPQLFVDELLLLARRSSRRARLGRFVQDIADDQASPLV
jgi:predicted glycosyltransferase